MPKPYPKIQHHKPSNRDRVRIPDSVRLPGEPEHLYLGPHGSPEASRAYLNFITERIDSAAAVPAEIRTRAGQSLLVIELATVHAEYLESTLHGRTGRAIETVRSDNRTAREQLLEQHARVRVCDFSAPDLRRIRDRMLRSNRWCRRVLNAHVGRIRGIFRWGSEYGFVPSHVFAGLTSLRELPRGEPGTRDYPRSRPAPPEHVVAVIHHLEARGQIQMAGLLRFMALSGSRAAEARAGRVRDLDRVARTLTIWQHKTVRKTGEPLVFPLTDDHLAAIDRALLARGGSADFDAPLFASSRGGPYSAKAVNQAVSTACERLRLPRFTPHQIRKTAAIAVWRAAGPDIAIATGGWSGKDMAEHYTRADLPSRREEGAEALAAYWRKAEAS